MRKDKKQEKHSTLLRKLTKTWFPKQNLRQNFLADRLFWNMIYREQDYRTEKAKEEEGKANTRMCYWVGHSYEQPVLDLPGPSKEPYGLYLRRVYPGDKGGSIYPSIPLSHWSRVIQVRVYSPWISELHICKYRAGAHDVVSEKQHGRKLKIRGHGMSL